MRRGREGGEIEEGGGRGRGRGGRRVESKRNKGNIGYKRGRGRTRRFEQRVK